MSNELDRVPAGPGRLTGALSLACFAVTLVVAVLAAALASDRFAAAGAAPGGSGLQFALKGGFIVLMSTVVAAGACLLGVVFGLAGVVLAKNHPRGKVLWPALGVALNGLPLLGASLWFLYLLFQNGGGGSRVQ